MSNEKFDKQSKVLRDQLVEKVCFFKKVLVLNPYPQTPFPRKGAERGAAALTLLGAMPHPHIVKNIGLSTDFK